MNKAPVDFGFTQTKNLDSSRAKERFQSPNISLNISKPELLDNNNEERNNVTFDVEPYETITAKRAYQTAFQSPVGNSLGYIRLSSPIMRPQSYGSRLRSTPKEDKIEWDYKTRFNDMTINLQKTLDDNVTKQMRLIEERFDMILEHELNRVKTEYEITINRKFEILEHHSILNDQETRLTANNLISSIDQKLKQDFDSKQLLITKIEQRLDSVENEYILRIRDLKNLLNSRIDNFEAKQDESLIRLK